MFWLESVLCISLFAASVIIYFNRVKTFKNTIIREQTEKYDRRLKVVFILMILVIVVYYIMNIDFYIEKLWEEVKLLLNFDTRHIGNYILPTLTLWEERFFTLLE